MQFLILGPLEVRGEQGAVALTGTKLRGLLAVLLLHANEPVSAERLAIALWGHDATAGATKTVQVHVSRLRKALGDPERIATTPAGYCLRVRPDELDVTRFERLVQQGRKALAGAEPRHAATLLRDALALWRGPALVELAFEPFALGEIERLEELRLAALEARIEADLADGRHAELVGELRSLAAAHPTRERLAAQLMLALYRCARQTDALEAYQEARRALVADVGVEPGPQLRELQEAILRHDVALQPSPGSPGVPHARDAVTVPALARFDDRPVVLALPRSLRTAAGSAFVGRDIELARLRGHWRLVGGGARSAVVIGGEPGIGKTRLASELAGSVHEQGALVLYGRCDEGLAVPYQPFVEAVRPYAHAAGLDRLRAELGDLAPDLGRLLPELGSLDRATHEDPESERFALFEAVAALLEAITRRQRVLLVLDDLHWAANPTLLLLRHLIRTERSLDVLLLCTYRATELDRAQPLAQLLADLHRDTSVQRLSIRGLDDAAIGALVDVSLGHPLDDRAELVRVLGAQTAGNPFFLQQLLTHLARLSELSNSGIAAAQLETPEELRDVIVDRVARLSVPAGGALRVAAVAGPSFSCALLEGVLGEEAGVLDGLEEAVGAGLLTESERGEYAFAHALVRQTIYEQLGASRRMRLHRRIGETLEALGLTEAYVEALAYHFAQAAADGQATKAATYALAAGSRAISGLGYEEAASHFERGLQALAVTGYPHERRRCELLLALGQARWSTGEADMARDAFEEAADIAAAIADAAAAADAALGFSGPPFFEVGIAVRPSTEVVLQRALAMLDEHDSALRARLTGRLASARAYAGGRHDHRVLADDALAMARQADDKHALADVLATFYWSTLGPDDPDQHLRTARELTVLAEEIGETRLLAYGRQWVMGHLLAQGEIDGVLRELDDLEKLARTRNDRFARWLPVVIRGTLAFLQGQLEHAESLALGALRQWGDRPQFAPATQLFSAQMIPLRREQGRLDELVERMAAVVEQSAEVPAWRCALAHIYAQLGERHRAARELELLGDLASVPRDAFWLVGATRVGTVASWLNDLSRSRQAYELLLPHADTCVVSLAVVCEGPTARPLGMLATTLGRYDDAEQHFERALEMSARIRSPLWTARTQHDYARTLLQRNHPDDRDKALQLLDQALTAARQLGLKALADEAQQHRAEAAALSPALPGPG